MSATSSVTAGLAIVHHTPNRGDASASVGALTSGAPCRPRGLRPRTPPSPGSLALARSTSCPARSRAGHLAPRQALVDARLGRQAEHALAEDVAHDLGGAARDRR